MPQCFLMGALGEVDEEGALSCGDSEVAPAMALYVPLHANHDWVDVLILCLLSTLILSEGSMLDMHPLGGR
jgi:hypothetical protein